MAEAGPQKRNVIETRRTSYWDPEKANFNARSKTGPVQNYPLDPPPPRPSASTLRLIGPPPDRPKFRVLFPFPARILCSPTGSSRGIVAAIQRRGPPKLKKSVCVVRVVSFVCCACCACVCFVRTAPIHPKKRHSRGPLPAPDLLRRIFCAGPRQTTPPTAENFALSSLSGVLSWNCGRDSRTSHKMTPEKPKRTLWVVHGLEPRPQFHEKTPQRDEKTTFAAEKGQKARNVGLPTRWAPHTPFSPTLRAPKKKHTKTHTPKDTKTHKKHTQKHTRNTHKKHTQETHTNTPKKHTHNKHRKHIRKNPHTQKAPLSPSPVSTTSRQSTTENIFEN